MIESIVATNIAVTHQTYTHMHTHTYTHTHTHTHYNTARWTLFGGNDTLQYWHVISRLAPAISVGSVEDMGEVQSELGKVGRVWGLWGGCGGGAE